MTEKNRLDMSRSESFVLEHISPKNTSMEFASDEEAVKFGEERAIREFECEKRLDAFKSIVRNMLSPYENLFAEDGLGIKSGKVKKTLNGFGIKNKIKLSSPQGNTEYESYFRKNSQGQKEFRESYVQLLTSEKIGEGPQVVVDFIDGRISGITYMDKKHFRDREYLQDLDGEYASAIKEHFPIYGKALHEWFIPKEILAVRLDFSGENLEIQAMMGKNDRVKDKARDQLCRHARGRISENYGFVAPYRKRESYDEYEHRVVSEDLIPAFVYDLRSDSGRLVFARNREKSRDGVGLMGYSETAPLSIEVDNFIGLMDDILKFLPVEKRYIDQELRESKRIQE